MALKKSQFYHRTEIENVEIATGQVDTRIILNDGSLGVTGLFYINEGGKPAKNLMHTLTDPNVESIEVTMSVIYKEGTEDEASG